jgi:hypothetical protein
MEWAHGVVLPAPEKVMHYAKCPGCCELKEQLSNCPIEITNG